MAHGVLQNKVDETSLSQEGPRHLPSNGRHPQGRSETKFDSE